MGIFLGYLFFKLKTVKLSYVNINFKTSTESRIYYINLFHKTTVALGWMLSTGLALTAILGGFTNHMKDGRRMETAEYAIFFSMTRLTWPISIGWIIFACHYGYGGLNLI